MSRLLQEAILMKKSYLIRKMMKLGDFSIQQLSGLTLTQLEKEYENLKVEKVNTNQ